VGYETGLVAICGFIVWLDRVAASKLRAEAREQFTEAFV